MSRCDGSSTRRYWGSAPTRRRCAAPACAPASSSCDNSRPLVHAPLATPALALDGAGRRQTGSVGETWPCDVGIVQALAWESLFTIRYSPETALPKLAVIHSGTICYRACDCEERRALQRMQIRHQRFKLL